MTSESLKTFQEMSTNGEKLSLRENNHGKKTEAGQISLIYVG